MRYSTCHCLRVIATNDVRIATDVMLLIMIIDLVEVLSVLATSAARSSGERDC